MFVGCGQSIERKILSPGFLQPCEIIVLIGYHQLRKLKTSSILIIFFVINSEILNSTWSCGGSLHALRYLSNIRYTL